MRILCNLYHLRGERFRARQSSSSAPTDVEKCLQVLCKKNHSPSTAFARSCYIHGKTGEVNDSVYYVRVFVIQTKIILGHFFFYVYPATPSKLQ